MVLGIKDVTNIGHKKKKGAVPSFFYISLKSHG